MIDLRDLQSDDAERLYAWRREPDVDRWMSGAAPADLGQYRHWLTEFRTDPDRAGWIILYRGQPTGFLTLSGLAGPNQAGQWGWYVGEAAARGRGVGRAAQALGLDRAFDHFGLQKVWSEVLAGNDAALKAQAAAGFRREGYLRRQVYKDGEFHDVVLLGMLVEEWRERRQTVLADLARSGLIAGPARGGS
jgi:UDP-4-amino-4,6-dideoxy-N-acetyl-beta-L-altrosamine N-acetyltransferase